MNKKTGFLVPLIHLHFFIAFFYFQLRSVYNTWVWLSIAPTLSIVYILAIVVKKERYPVKFIDFILILMALYGVGSCIVGFVVDAVDMDKLIKYLIHCYLPLSLFFVIRIYISTSYKNLNFIFKLLVIYGGIFAVTILMEYVCLSYFKMSPKSFFWMKPEFAITYDVFNVKSILLSRHKAAFILVFVFALLFPVVAFKLPPHKFQPKFHKGWGALILIIILFDITVLNVKTSYVSIPILIAAHIFLSRTPKKMKKIVIGSLFLSVMVFMIFPGQYATIKEDYFVNILPNGLTPFEKIVGSFETILHATKFDEFAYVLGGSVTPFKEEYYNLYGGITEARLFSYHLFFGGVGCLNDFHPH